MDLTGFCLFFSKYPDVLSRYAVVTMPSQVYGTTVKQIDLLLYSKFSCLRCIELKEATLPEILYLAKSRSICMLPSWIPVPYVGCNLSSKERMPLDSHSRHQIIFLLSILSYSEVKTTVLTDKRFYTIFTLQKEHSLLTDREIVL